MRADGCKSFNLRVVSPEDPGFGEVNAMRTRRDMCRKRCFQRVLLELRQERGPCECGSAAGQRSPALHVGDQRDEGVQQDAQVCEPDAGRPDGGVRERMRSRAEQQSWHPPGLTMRAGRDLRTGHRKPCQSPRHAGVQRTRSKCWAEAAVLMGAEAPANRSTKEAAAACLGTGRKRRLRGGSHRQHSEVQSRRGGEYLHLTGTGNIRRGGCS